MTNDLYDDATPPDPPPPADAAAEDHEALEAQFKADLPQASYYSVGRHWNDYAPAYRFGRDSRRRHAGSRFEDIEHQLEQEWSGARDKSRLGWIEARGAVEDAWSRTPEDGTDVALDAPVPRVG
ncbi:hypothetical protein LDO31_01220 [Luteimonas sp. XNQY3]|nr:hypothetical protein [Luteimonas sp. XNQY3]MCD9004874.1 hypothetical protein [Luteimonas sp. XNQY3]